MELRRSYGVTLCELARSPTLEYFVPKTGGRRYNALLNAPHFSPDLVVPKGSCFLECKEGVLDQCYSLRKVIFALNFHTVSWYINLAGHVY